MSGKTIAMPKFKTEDEEADWWASPEGRAYVRRKSAGARLRGTKVARSSLVAARNKKASVPIAIRLPDGDIKKARQIAGRKGIGYQTLLRMFVREGLQREARRR